MGPIRAFSRPSHGLAAGEFVTSASPYSHAPGYSAARRPCCAHSSSPLASHHSALPHSHLFGTVCATDPLRVGLVSSPAASPTCLFPFKNLLPPGAPSPDTYLAVPAQQDARGGSQGAAGDAEGSERRRRDIPERGWEDGSDCERKRKEQRKSKKKSVEKKLKKSEHRSKNKQHNGAHRRHDRKPESKWEEFGDNNAHKKNKSDSKLKNKSDSLTWKKLRREHRWIKSGEQHDLGRDRREEKWNKNNVNPASLSSPPGKTDDPCTSRMPFSDDDDDGCGHDGEGERESTGEPWPISDIVETEDEEGEGKCEQAEDPPREDLQGDGPPPQRLSSAVNHAEAGGVLRRQATPAAEHSVSAVTQNGISESESNFGSVPPDVQDWQESPPAVEKHDLAQDYDTDEELQLEEQGDHGNDDKRRSGEDDWPRDGVRATQRLRPRSYR